MENYKSMFRFTWPRALLVAVVAIGGFLVPQAVPLEYAPLNNPSSGTQYLEITCASNIPGTTEIYLGTGRGFNELEKITIPMGPSDMAYPYTFPLADAPLVDLRIDPFARGAGELTITNLRIINRKGDEIRRFGASDFVDLEQVMLKSAPIGWKLVTNGDADDPRARIHLSRAIVAKGMNERNLKRCLISVGYLSVMLSILLLAVYFIFWNRPPLAEAFREVAFIAFVALSFSVVGNRGLLSNSVRFAHGALFLPHEPVVVYGPIDNLTAGQLYLEITCASDVLGLAEIFLDTGHGFNPGDKLLLTLEPSDGARTYTLALPDRPLRGLRMDPFLQGPGQLTVGGLRVVNRRLDEIRRFGAADLQSNYAVDTVTLGPSGWVFVATENSTDPGFVLRFGDPLVPSGMARRELLRGLHLTPTFYADFALPTDQQQEYDLIKLGEVTRLARLGPGWHDPDGTSRWMSGRAQLFFRSGPQGVLIIEGYLPEMLAPNTISITAIGQAITSRALPAGPMSLTVAVPANRTMALVIEFQKHLVPRDAGLNDDIRDLGAIISNISTR